MALRVCVTQNKSHAITEIEGSSTVNIVIFTISRSARGNYWQRILPNYP